MRFAGAAMSDNYISSAGKGNSELFKKIGANAPDFGSLGMNSMIEQSKTKQSAMYAAGQVAGTGMQSLGAAAEAQNNAKATIAGAEAEASATQMGGMMDMFGSIGGAAFGAMKPSFSYGKTKMGAGGGVVGGYGTLGPNYGIKQY